MAEEKKIEMNDGRKDAINLLKTARGQTDGIINMIEDGRYCIDVSKQLLSLMGLIKKANMKILEQHIKSCIVDAVEEGSGEEKIEEIVMILNKYTK